MKIAPGYQHIILPNNKYDQELITQCHPPDWINPKVEGKYNLVVLGGGTAGLVSAGGTGGLGGKVALIEKSLLGGDCLVTGCVPSKALIRAARAAYAVTHAKEFGVTISTAPQLDFAQAMERLRKLRAEIAPHDSAVRFKNDFKVDVFLGNGKFVSPDEIEVAGQRLRFDRAVIATGARAEIPAIPGLREIEFFTNENIFTLTALPQHLVILGAGPIGCELAQAFRRFGAQVTLITNGAQLLPREDQDAAVIIKTQLEVEGIKLIFNAKINSVRQSGNCKTLTLQDVSQEIQCDAMLVATGRKPNVEGIGLEAAKIKFSQQGIEVDNCLRTSNPRVFAAGDVCSRLKFTHAADAMARHVIANAFFFGRRKVSMLTIPWCTFTDPEIAHVGLYEADATTQGYEVVTLTQPFDDVDRAILDNEITGFVRVHYEKKSGRILGGTIVARHAGEMIGQLTQAISQGLKMSALASTIQPYPVQADALKKIGDAYMRTKLTPAVKMIMQKWFVWRQR